MTIISASCSILCCGLLVSISCFSVNLPRLCDLIILFIKAFQSDLFMFIGEWNYKPILDHSRGNKYIIRQRGSNCSSIPEPGWLTSHQFYQSTKSGCRSESGLEKLVEARYLGLHPRTPPKKGKKKKMGSPDIHVLDMELTNLISVNNRKVDLNSAMKTCAWRQTGKHSQVEPDEGR